MYQCVKMLEGLVK